VETWLDASTLIVRVPSRFQRQGGCKRIDTSDRSKLVRISKPQSDRTLT
jgi:hypothetical protein